MIRRILAKRFEKFDLDARFFPEATKDLIPLEALIRWGALPLGYKSRRSWFCRRKRLNLGLLDPGSKDDASNLSRWIAGTDVRRFQIRADEFLAVLLDRYGMSQEYLARLPSEQIHPKLREAIANRSAETGKPPGSP